LYINGAWRHGSDGGLADDVNPATGEVFARIAQAGRADVEDALVAADGARHAWQNARERTRSAAAPDRRNHCFSSG
jgi:aldehyde dehydrogenase (NAD+)